MRVKNTSIISDLWSHPVEIARSNFKHKSLSCWSMNTTVGCSHGCRFCYVPSVTGIFQRTALAEYGVQDPDLDWGAYAFLRPWDEKKFRASLRSAERTPVSKLNSDGHRAVMLSTTTDAYQVIRNPDPAKQKELNTAHRQMVRRALELILSESTLNVRILTRSPWAREDFDLFKEFGHRLTFGMSLPTLRDDWRKVHEPKAPSVAKRLETLRAAKEAGLHVYVAVAPTYPE
ncbi:MAG: radical SAM protein, partial [Verrucomicrobiaceae bacterium]